MKQQLPDWLKPKSTMTNKQRKAALKEWNLKHGNTEHGRELMRHIDKIAENLL